VDPEATKITVQYPLTFFARCNRLSRAGPSGVTWVSVAMSRRMQTSSGECFMEYQYQSSGSMGIVPLLFMLLITIAIIAGVWKVFVKAGKPGWASLIPIYNVVVILQIVGRPIWWLVLLFIPFVNFVVAIIISIDMAKSFGKGTGFGIGLALLGVIFYPMLGFGDARYQGPSAPQALKNA